MPVIIWTPQPDAPFGQGFVINVESTDVGPFSNPKFRIELMDGDFVGNVLPQMLQSTGGSQQMSISYLGLSSVMYALGARLNVGDTAKLRVSFEHDFGVVSTTNIDVTLSNDGLAQILNNKLAEVGFSTQGVPTILSVVNAIQTTVGNIASALSKTFAPGIISPLTDLLLNPPPNFVVRELIGNVEGNDSFQRPAGGHGVAALGIAWEVLTYGEGIGVDPSVPTRFETELLDVDVVHTDGDDHEFTSAFEVFQQTNYYYFFNRAFPTRVNVRVAPSVTLQMYWLVLGTL